MNHKLAQLAAQRNALVNQAAFQRIELAVDFEKVTKPIRLLDQSWFAVRYLGNHPVLLAGSLALASAVFPKRWFKILESGWLAWRVIKATKRKLKD